MHDDDDETPVPVDTRRVRQLAVEADVDPRTLAARLRGAPVRTGAVRERIDKVLAAHGLAPVAMKDRG